MFYLKENSVCSTNLYIIWLNFIAFVATFLGAFTLHMTLRFIRGFLGGAALGNNEKEITDSTH